MCDEDAERLRAERNAKRRARYLANREQALARSKAYRAANREKILASQAAYREANRDKLRAADKAIEAVMCMPGACAGPMWLPWTERAGLDPCNLGNLLRPMAAAATGA